MIFDSLKNLEQYKTVHPRIYRGLQLLRDTDFAALTESRYEVEGEDLFFFLQDYETRPVNDTPEAHRKYADIQFVLSGREKFDVAPLQDMTEEVEAHPDRDLWLYHGPGQCQLCAGGGQVRGGLPRRCPRPLYCRGCPGAGPQSGGESQAVSA